MGDCCGGSPGGNTEERKRTKAIDRELREHGKKTEHEIKLLLLGAGESGKSTLAKQLKIIHQEGFTDQERIYYKPVVLANAIRSMKALLSAAEKFGYVFQDHNRERAGRWAMITEADPLLPPLAADARLLWEDNAIQQAYRRQNEFQLSDSAAYYMTSMERLAGASYLPTDMDILRSRAKTVGIIETEFNVGPTRFRLVDVGGQRSERKKWVQCFTDVTAVIFVVGMSEYNQKMYEDDTTNRMHDTLRLFQEMINSKWLVSAAMVLFLNKRDVFQEKIKHIDLSVCFPDYKAGKNYDAAVEFMKNRFLEQNERPDRAVYTHVTCATDTNNVNVVFTAVKDYILSKALEEAGMSMAMRIT
eukprot:TRINITY_DN5334_c0_g1_i2.p1 TRINITY_DN5334_c0_g1~~TRINITY_DN5334_c0_g1_i2.p1  ORF type:complete len:359 (-),score=69.47 TRINITY_DN5334_c0_g1_i2:75-1151(-)